MRPFYLNRKRDPSGVSGVGIVAEGVEFSDGSAVVRWKGERATTVLHDSMDSVMIIHGHGGDTEVVFLDSEDPPSEHKPLGTRCSVCGRQQFLTPGGETCPSGHGGAPPLMKGEDPSEGWYDIGDSIEWGSNTEGVDATLAEVLGKGNR